jgi:hypothetical protein
MPRADEQEADAGIRFKPFGRRDHGRKFVRPAEIA